MANIVDIEIMTFEVLLFLLKSDIKLYESAVTRKWENGIKLYSKRIDTVFDKIDKIKSLIMGSVNWHQDAIEIAKTSATATSYKQRYNSESNLIMSLLTTLKASSFELEMYRSGFKEFMDDSRLNDMADIVHKVGDDGELRRYRIHDDGSNTELFNETQT